MSKKQFSDSDIKKGDFGYSSESKITSSYKNNYSKNRRSSVWSGILAVIQLIASIAFVGLIIFKNFSIKIHILAGILSVLVILLAAVFALAQKNSLGAKRVGKVISVFVILLLSVPIYFLASMSGERVSDEPFVFYVTASDTFGDISEDTPTRSDTNILAVVNPKTQTVLMVSTPRDYYVEVIAESVVPNSYDKLTHVSLYGNGIAHDGNGNDLTANDWDWAGNTYWHTGYKAIKDTLRNLYDINITDKDFHHLKVNFTSFAKLIDTIGGITVDVDRDFNITTYASYGNTDTGERKTYKFKKGKMKMDGATALSFARERKSFGDGDVQRNKNQIKVVKAIAKKILSLSTIFNIQDTVDSVKKCFTIDDEKLYSSMIALQIQIMGYDNYDGWNIMSYSVDGYSGREILTWNGLSKSVVKPDPVSVSNASSLIDMVLNGSTAEEVKKQIKKYSK